MIDGLYLAGGQSRTGMQLDRVWQLKDTELHQQIWHL